MKNQELAAATKEAEKLLREISESTAVAEKEKHKVAVIVEAVSKQARGAGSLTYLALTYIAVSEPARLATRVLAVHNMAAVWCCWAWRASWLGC